MENSFLVNRDGSNCLGPSCKDQQNATLLTAHNGLDSFSVVEILDLIDKVASMCSGTRWTHKMVRIY